MRRPDGGSEKSGVVRIRRLALPWAGPLLACLGGNDIGDWDTALHTFTFASAVHQGLRRAPSAELVRGVLISIAEEPPISLIVSVASLTAASKRMDT